MKCSTCVEGILFLTLSNKLSYIIYRKKYKISVTFFQWVNYLFICCKYLDQVLSVLINYTSYWSSGADSYGTKSSCKKIKCRMKKYLQKEAVNFKHLIPKGLHGFIPVKTLAHNFSVYLFLIFVHNVFIFLIFRQHMENEEWQFWVSLDASCCPPNNELPFQKQFISLSFFHKKTCRTIHVVSLLGHFYEPHVILFTVASEFNLRAICSCDQIMEPRPRRQIYSLPCISFYTFKWCEGHFSFFTYKFLSLLWKWWILPC